MWEEWNHSSKQVPWLQRIRIPSFIITLLLLSWLLRNQNTRQKTTSQGWFCLARTSQTLLTGQPPLSSLLSHSLPSSTLCPRNKNKPKSTRITVEWACPHSPWSSKPRVLTRYIMKILSWLELDGLLGTSSLLLPHFVWSCEYLLKSNPCFQMSVIYFFTVALWESLWIDKNCRQKEKPWLYYTVCVCVCEFYLYIYLITSVPPCADTFSHRKGSTETKEIFLHSE